MGTIFSVTGAALFSTLQFDETFVWPLLAEHAEQLLDIKGPMFTDPAFFAAYLVMGALFALGFVFVAAQSLKCRIFPVVPSVFLLIWWEKSSSKRLTLILVIISATVLAGIVPGIIQAI